MAADAVRLHALVDLAEHQVGLRPRDRRRRRRSWRRRRGRRSARPVRAGRAPGWSPSDSSPATRRSRRRRVGERGQLGAMELRQAVDRLRRAGRGAGARSRTSAGSRPGRAGGSPGPRSMIAVPSAMRSGTSAAAVPWGRARNTASAGGQRRRARSRPVVGEVRVDAAERVAVAVAALEPDDRDVRVPRQEPDQLGADVAGRADDPDADAARAAGRVDAALGRGPSGSSKRGSGRRSWSDDYTARLHSHATMRRRTLLVRRSAPRRRSGRARPARPDAGDEVRHPPAQEVQAAAEAVAGHREQRLEPGDRERRAASRASSRRARTRRATGSARLMPRTCANAAGTRAPARSGPSWATLTMRRQIAP